MYELGVKKFRKKKKKKVGVGVGEEEEEEGGGLIKINQLIRLEKRELQKEIS